MAARSERIASPFDVPSIRTRANQAASRPFEGLITQLRFYGEALATVPRALHYRKVILALVSDMTIGVGALVIGAGTFFVIFAMAFFTGTQVGLEGFQGLQQIGAQAFTGLVSSWANTREITPLVAGVALAAQVGTSFTAELGAARISEEIDALEVMAIPSMVYMVGTRIWAALITIIPLYLAALFASYLATQAHRDEVLLTLLGVLRPLLPPLPAADRRPVQPDQGADLCGGGHPHPLLLRLQRHGRASRCGGRVGPGHPKLHRHGGGPQPVPVVAVLGRRRHGPPGIREVRVSTKAPSTAGGPVESRPLSVPKGPGPLRRLPSWLKGMVILIAAFAVMYSGLRWAYGGFGDYYYVSVDLPRASQQLQVGSDVRMSGVIVGQVTEIKLVDRHVRVRLQIDRQYRVPMDASADVDLTTLLGAKFINVKFDSYTGPFLADGGRITTSHVGPELEDALADGVAVFDAIRPDDLATIITELATGARGHGADVARGIEANMELTRLFAKTLDPQLESLNDLSVVFGALRHTGADLNELADAVNEGVPVYASEAAQRELDAALRALVPFADNLADLLILNRSDWDKLISGGDAVLGTLASSPADLHRLVLGAFQYVQKLGGAPHYRGNGSADAGFVNFIGGNDPDETLAQFCGALPPEIRDIVPICGGTPE